MGHIVMRGWSESPYSSVGLVITSCTLSFFSYTLSLILSVPEFILQNIINSYGIFYIVLFQKIFIFMGREVKFDGGKGSFSLQIFLLTRRNYGLYRSPERNQMQIIKNKSIYKRQQSDTLV
ncbi:hypothetical protein V8G54_025078 [Vigna mungo]|uniref:Uncharacterized protein n=1 Tax=Vigna mungo TaxID=3915 RepID=A0AAQ3N7D8_VIGMU